MTANFFFYPSSPGPVFHPVGLQICGRLPLESTHTCLLLLVGATTKETSSLIWSTHLGHTSGPHMDPSPSTHVKTLVQTWDPSLWQTGPSPHTTEHLSPTLHLHTERVHRPSSGVVGSTLQQKPPTQLESAVVIEFICAVL